MTRCHLRIYFAVPAVAMPELLGESFRFSVATMSRSSEGTVGAARASHCRAARLAIETQGLLKQNTALIL